MAYFLYKVYHFNYSYISHNNNKKYFKKTLDNIISHAILKMSQRYNNITTITINTGGTAMLHKLYTILEHLDGERGIKLIPYKLAQRVKVWLLININY